MPDRQFAVHVLGLGCWWPPDLVVSGGEDLAQLGAGDGPPDRDVDVRGKTALGFDCSEVLDVVSGEPAQVLDEPVEQRRKADRVPGCPRVVVSAGFGWSAIV